jgi:hypothetical protein
MFAVAAVWIQVRRFSSEIRREKGGKKAQNEAGPREKRREEWNKPKNKGAHKSQQAGQWAHHAL